MKLFVTGGTGFVGSHFVQQALFSGHEVIALRRLGSKTRIPLPLQPIWIDGVLDGDHSESLRNVDVLVHFASHTPNPPYAALDECLYWNVYAAVRLARQAMTAGVKRYLVAGSCFEYGQAGENLEFIDTSTPLAPTLSYPTSKAAASVAFEGFSREHGLKLKLLRIFQVFGEGEQETRMWPSLRAAALAGEDFPMSAGAQVRDFIPVESVASQFLRHLDFSSTGDGVPEVHHIATGTALTLLEFATYWWKYWGATGQLRPGNMPYRTNELFRLVPRPLAGHCGNPCGATPVGLQP